jgi:hypothetical protein
MATARRAQPARRGSKAPSRRTRVQHQQPSGPAPEPPPVPEWRTARQRVEELGGFRAGQRVEVTREDGLFTIQSFTVPAHPDDPATEPWADLYGGKKGEEMLRSFRLDRLVDPATVDAKPGADHARQAVAPKPVPGEGSTIRERREAAGKSRGDLARAADLPYGLLTRIEGGTRGMTPDEAKTIDNALRDLEAGQ